LRTSGARLVITAIRATRVVISSDPDAILLRLTEPSSTPDSLDTSTSIDELRFFAAPPHECSYLPDRHATTLFADPEAGINTRIYSQLSAVGFRRSGKFIYRPHCEGCKACVPIRVLVQHYAPRRRQRRIWKQNQDLTAIEQTPVFREEHYALYQRYIDTRHVDGDMYPASEEQYQSFLIEGRPEASFVEFRAKSKLVAVAVIDTLTDGLSSIYTYFDPDEDKRSPGGFAIQWTIERARKMALPYLYLGYWIADSKKMSYKCDYQPFERFDGRRWHTSAP